MFSLQLTQARMWLLMNKMIVKVLVVGIVMIKTVDHTTEPLKKGSNDCNFFLLTIHIFFYLQKRDK